MIEFGTINTAKTKKKCNKNYKDKKFSLLKIKVMKKLNSFHSSKSNTSPIKKKKVLRTYT